MPEGPKNFDFEAGVVSPSEPKKEAHGTLDTEGGKEGNMVKEELVVKILMAFFTDKKVRDLVRTELGNLIVAEAPEIALELGEAIEGWKSLQREYVKTLEVLRKEIEWFELASEIMEDVKKRASPEGLKIINQRTPESLFEMLRVKENNLLKCVEYKGKEFELDKNHLPSKFKKGVRWDLEATAFSGIVDSAITTNDGYLRPHLPPLFGLAIEEDPEAMNELLNKMEKVVNRWGLKAIRSEILETLPQNKRDQTVSITGSVIRKDGELYSYRIIAPGFLDNGGGCVQMARAKAID